MMLGKIMPYIMVGYVQLMVIILAAVASVRRADGRQPGPVDARDWLFIAANLASATPSRPWRHNQLQAMQMTFFFFLPSMLLSGFMFPFRGMPPWAQWMGELLPLTHFLRIVRAIMLKGASLSEVVPNLWPMALFLLVVGAIALKRYRQTLD